MHAVVAWGFLWVNGFSFFHCVASPFHSFVTIHMHALASPRAALARAAMQRMAAFDCGGILFVAGGRG